MAVAFNSHYDPNNPEQEQASNIYAHPEFVYGKNTTSSDQIEINELRQQNLAFAKQSTQLETIIERMPTGMVVLDGDGIVTKVNNVAQQLLDEPILGQPWYQVIQRSFKPRADDWHEVSLKDGRRVKLEITALGDQPGQLIMITDMTETRLLQDKLGQLQRLSSLGRMVSTLAHQIRTPLSAAMLYGANLSNANLAEPARDNFQDKLMSRLQDLEKQVNDMLLFAKSGNQQVVNEIEVNKLIESSVASLEPIVAKADAKVNVSYCNSHCKILGNEVALTGAIQNLIQNAIQAHQTNKSPTPLEVSLASECHGQHVYISVKDNGKGIDPKLTDKIFEPFYTSKVQGTGLGLAVVKSVANAHQGDVKLISRAGEGANFCIKLPRLVAGQNIAKEANKDVAGSQPHMQFEEVTHG